MQTWKHTKSAPTMSLSTKCAWIFKKAISLMESAMNRNSPNMWDHMLICWGRHKLIDCFVDFEISSSPFRSSTKISTPSRASTAASCDIPCGWTGWTGDTSEPVKQIRHTSGVNVSSNLHLHHRSLTVVGTCDNSPPVLSLTPPSLSPVRQKVDYHISLCNYYCCCYNSCVYWKLSETSQKQISLFTLNISRAENVSQTRIFKVGELKKHAKRNFHRHKFQLIIHITKGLASLVSYS